MALQHRFQARLDLGQWWLSTRVDRTDGAQRSIGAEHPWLSQRKSFLGWLQEGVARLLRWAGHALLASPVLVIPYALLPSGGPAAGWLVVLFVCTVVAFFAALNLFILIALLRHLFVAQLTLRLWDVDADSERTAEALLFAEGALPTSKTGRVIGIGAPLDGDIVLRELISRARNVRVLEASDFAIQTDNEELVVVRLEDAPLLLAAREADDSMPLPEGTRAALAEGGIIDPQRERGLRMHVVRVGDRVTVTGLEDTPISRTDRFELGGEPRAIKSSEAPGAAYRGERGDSARLLRAVTGVPILIARETKP